MSDSKLINTNNTALPQGMVAALKRVLRPLVRLLIAKGVTLPWLVSLLKSVYVEIAESDFQINGKRQTDSRISLLSGVHRKDVRRLRENHTQRDEAPESISMGARLVSHWASNLRYRNAEGKPLTLSLRQTRSDLPSFEMLVEEVSRKDIHARVILDELSRLGIVKMVENDRISLTTDAFVPTKGQEEKTWYFGRNLGDHMATGVHNLLESKPSLLERSVSYGGLSQADINALEEKIHSRAMTLLKSINNDASDFQAQSDLSATEGKRFTFGVFFHKGDDDEK